MSIFNDGILHDLAERANPLDWFDETALFALTRLYGNPSAWGKATTLARHVGVDTFALEKAVRASMSDFNDDVPDRYDIADLVREPRNVPRWAVERLLPESGLSVLAGAPKAGKSTLARYIIACVASGKPCFGREVTKGVCLYYVLEEKKDEVIDDFRRRGVVTGVYLRFGRLPRHGFLSVLREDVAEIRPVLCVADPMFDALGAADANDYVVMNDAMKDVVATVRQGTPHLMFVHHANKSGIRTAASILGSRAIEGATDTNLILEERDDGKRVLFTSQRYGERIPMSFVEFDKDTMALRLRERGKI